MSTHGSQLWQSARLRCMNSTPERILDPKAIAAMKVCLDHARALLECARAVQGIDHPNVAYHLAALALEEIGRRELIGVQMVISHRPDRSTWATNHTHDHVKKLFWCFFGTVFAHRRLTGGVLEEIRGAATLIHSTRLAGLYVENDDEGMSIPKEAITSEQCKELLALAAARLGMAETEELREDVPAEEIALKGWFHGD